MATKTMNAIFWPPKARDIRLLEHVLSRTSQRRLFAAARPRVTSSKPQWVQHSFSRGAKTVIRKKLSDLPQGPVQAEPLPALDIDDAPQYPSVLQDAKMNMLKFENCVLLTRVGNFYELYFEQAEEYGPLLNLKVGYKKTRLGPVAMAGFPFFQLDRFLKALVQDCNKYVAISEEFPNTATGKVKSAGLLFNRRVARVVTPGTLIDEKFIDPYENNFLLSINLPEGQLKEDDVNDGKEAENPEHKQDVGLAWLDLTTGDFFTQTTSRTLLSSSLTRIGAREVILSQKASPDAKEEVQATVGHRHLLTYYDCEHQYVSMSQWNEMIESPIEPDNEAQFTIQEKLAGHQLLDYVRYRLQGLNLRLQPPRRRVLESFLGIDRNSLRGLEILETSRDGFGKGSLFHAVRRTATKSGARLLRDRLTSPSASKTDIDDRLDLVSTFFAFDDLRETLTEHLRRTYDVQRLVQKFAMNKGDADDMLCLARAIGETSAAIEVLRAVPTYSSHKEAAEDMISTSPFSKPISKLIARIDLAGPSLLGEHITNAIDEEGLSEKHRLEEDEAANIAALAQEVVSETAPEELNVLPKVTRMKAKSVETRDQDLDLEEPWIMRKGASPTLSRLHDDLDHLKEEKAALAQRLRDELAAPSLMLKWTPGLGHICHIRSATGFDQQKLDNLHARMVSSSKSTRSFYLTDWSRLGNRVDQAKLSIRGEEQRIFGQLRQHVIKNLVKLRRNAAVMDEIDVATGFAALAKEQSWIRPQINTSTSHRIIGGRHPTVKLGLEEQGRSFVSNDLVLDARERIWLVTGPNMAGKSTFLRQNALITILAQAGSYVPAEHAEIGLVDQIFSRIGAADDLFRDQSTFMVEMLETAAILKQATSRSFVIMDEVGRGTTPEDGTAVGYASLHHLYHINKSRTLFATHFHALADMTETWQHLGRYCTDLQEDQSGSFTFIHRLRKGVNRQSHALKVAKLAGLPPAALEVAADVLNHINMTRNASIQPEENFNHFTQPASVSASG